MLFISFLLFLSLQLCLTPLNFSSSYFPFFSFSFLHLSFSLLILPFLFHPILSFLCRLSFLLSVFIHSLSFLRSLFYPSQMSRSLHRFSPILFSFLYFFPRSSRLLARVSIGSNVDSRSAPITFFFLVCVFIFSQRGLVAGAQSSDYLSVCTSRCFVIPSEWRKGLRWVLWVLTVVIVTVTVTVAIG